VTRAERVIAFIERYCFVPEGAKVGQPLILAGFQKRFLREVYDNPKGTRRAYLAIARKNGKTGLIAGIVLAHLVGPEAVQNSQIVSGARSRDQAALVFNLAAKMCQLNPELAKLVRIVPSGKRLIGLARNVEYRALAADGTTAHGLSPVLAILDEVGQVKGPQDDFVDAITTAQGAYDDPLLIAISTQAPTDADLFSIWLDGAAASKDPRIVSHVYTAPEGCELDDEEAWKAANPALDLFRSRKDLEEQAQRAKEMPSAQNTFRVLCLNQRVNMFSPLIGKDEWFACKGEAKIESGEAVYLALDLSSVDDLTALLMVSADDGDRIEPFIWKPEEVLERHGTRDNVDYRAWRDAGHLLTSPGRTIDPAVVAMKIAELMQAYTVLGLAYDRWRIDALIKELDRLGIETHKDDEGSGLKLIDWGQGYASMAPAIDAFERSVLERALVHPGNPVLTWNVANAVVTQDAAGNRKLDKAKARFRIDGAVAAAMALGLKAKERANMTVQTSPWDDPSFSLVA
jgi:phage terminase large subunit-like protein